MSCVLRIVSCASCIIYRKACMAYREPCIVTRAWCIVSRVSWRVYGVSYRVVRFPARRQTDPSAVRVCLVWLAETKQHKHLQKRLSSASDSDVAWRRRRNRWKCFKVIQKTWLLLCNFTTDCSAFSEPQTSNTDLYKTNKPLRSSSKIKGHE